MAQTHVNQPSKSASCETSKQTHAQPLLQYITEATEAPIFESGKALGHTQFHCADAFHLTLRVEGLDAVKHHARRTFLGQVVRTCHDEHQVDTSACCIHDERSILVSGTCTAVSAFKLTLTRPRLWAPCSESHCKPRKVRTQKQRENQNHRNKNTYLSRMLKTRNKVKQVTCTKEHLQRSRYLKSALVDLKTGHVSARS